MLRVELWEVALGIIDFTKNSTALPVQWIFTGEDWLQDTIQILTSAWFVLEPSNPCREIRWCRLERFCF